MLSFSSWDVSHDKHSQVGNFIKTFIFFFFLFVYFFSTAVPSILGCSFYVFKTESPSLSGVFMLASMFVLKFRTVFLRRILKGALLGHGRIA